MEVAFECLPCTLQSCRRLLKEKGLPASGQERLIRETLRFLADADWTMSPPALARDLHAVLRREMDDPDPYRQIKKNSNDAMLELVPALRERLAAAADPFAIAVRLAVAGNVIDFGAKHLFDPRETIERVLTADLAIDATADLRADLDAAGSILYVGDNAGEIVMDSLFLEALDRDDVTFVVRGGPVINDATLEDARRIGIDGRARVITTGDDSPGVIAERASDEFRAALASADVVIAKGQGNLEGLWGADREIYFLLTVKCERIARSIGVGVGDFIVWHYRPLDGRREVTD